MLYKVVLVSAIQHDASAIHMHVSLLSGLPFHSGYHSALSTVPSAIQEFLVSFYFIHSKYQ